MLDCFGNVTRFFLIESYGLSFADRTKAAMARADISAQHESRGPVRPAFKDVWAPGFLTNRVQVQPLDQLQKMVLIGRITQTNAQPFRFGLPGLGIQDS